MSFVSGRQSLGARERQEDSFRIIRQNEADPGTDLLILMADGMGGHVGGEVASRLVVEVFEKHCITLSRNPKPADRLVEALEAANSALRDRIRREPELAGMGSTLVAAMKLGNKLYWLSVGDSVLYLLRDGTLRRLNADHSVYGELMEHVREGRLTQQEADQHPKRNALRSAIIGDRIALVDCNAIVLQQRDLFLAASDGLETLDDRQIAELMMQPDRSDPAAISADLLTAVDQAGRPRQDNTSVVVYRYDPSAKSALSTESLFRSADASPARPFGPIGFAGGAAAVAVALVGLIYVIGWGGKDSPPQRTDGGDALAAPDTGQAVVKAPVRGPTTIARSEPDAAETVVEGIGPETPAGSEAGIPEAVDPAGQGRPVTSPDAVPPIATGTGTAEERSDPVPPDPRAINGPAPLDIQPPHTGAADAEGEDDALLGNQSAGPSGNARPRPRPVILPAGE